MKVNKNLFFIKTVKGYVGHDQATKLTQLVDIWRIKGGDKYILSAKVSKGRKKMVINRPPKKVDLMVFCGECETNIEEPPRF